MADVIIGIHGLGNKPPESLLKDWWQLSMIEGLNTGNHNLKLPEFRIAIWSDILYEKPLDINEKDDNSPYFIDEKYIRAGDNFQITDHSTRKKVVDYLGKQMNRIFLNDDLTMNYSFITDAIIGRYFKDLELYYSGEITNGSSSTQSYRELIRQRLCDKLIKHRDDRIMLISHSMGTVIAYDVLTFMLPDIRVDTFVTMGSPLGLPVIMSNIAAELKMNGKNSNLITPPGIMKNWYNYSDILDKVAFNYKLSDYYTQNDHGVKPVDLLVTNNYEINGIKNPHKVFGYLRTPEFSEVLSGFILSGKLTTAQWISIKMDGILKKIGFRTPVKGKNK
ncbi:MAG: hypothetical protein GYA41_09655 [Bacteroidales bacterium]|nr:hypothetical protein [Bacteroidales bacterium]